MYHLGLSEGWWSIIDNIYNESTEHVRWKGIDSNPFSTSQGVKQGSIISPMLYKAYVNNLLEILQRNNLGLNVGSLYIGSPTCADDVLLMSNNCHELQAMLDVCYVYSKCQQYELHPQSQL
jgi:hypothetical protein